MKFYLQKEELDYENDDCINCLITVVRNYKEYHLLYYIKNKRELLEFAIETFIKQYEIYTDIYFPFSCDNRNETERIAQGMVESFQKKFGNKWVCVLGDDMNFNISSIGEICEKAIHFKIDNTEVLIISL